MSVTTSYSSFSFADLTPSAYLDTFYGFGPYAFELLAGYDCPTYATFLNSSFHASEVSKTHPNSICMFEHDMGYLIQRHSSDAYLATTRNIAFTVRSVSTGMYLVV